MSAHQRPGREEQSAAVVQLAGAIRRLPMMPAVASQLADWQQLDVLHRIDLARWVSFDPALVGRLLSQANAPGYGAPGRVLTLGAALHLLGREALITLVRESLPLRMIEQPVLAPLWREHLVCAALARELHGRRGEGGSEAAYVAGLLHDVGGLVLLSCWPQRYARVLRRRHADPRQRRHEEQRRFGVDGAQLGAELLRQWGLPPAIVEAVQLQTEARIPEAPLAATVWQASRLSQRAAEFRPGQEEPDWMREIGLDLPLWRRLVEPIDAITIERPAGVPASAPPRGLPAHLPVADRVPGPDLHP